MKFLNKKISLGPGLAALFIISSAVYSIGYKIAMDRFNSIVSLNQENQKIYGDLSEIDYSIRNEYIGNFDESKVFEAMNRGYVSGLEDCKFLSSQEYSSYLKERQNIPAEVSWDEIYGLGYIRCKSLGKGSADMFIERIDYFISKGISKIIIDLRLSEIGKIGECFKILQYLLPEGNAVYAIDKKGGKEVACKATGTGISADIVVLVGNDCSTAAEVIASGMKDNLKAKIVGKKTKGNLVREKVSEISQNSVIIFPDAKYITSGGTDLYKKGLTPDKEVELSEEELKLLKEEKLPYSDDLQFQEAMKMFLSSGGENVE